VTVVTPQSEKTVEITNESGLHMIPSQLLCEVANHFDSAVSIGVGEATLNAKLLLNLLGLALEKGTVITVQASGPDAGAAVDAVVTLVESEFDLDVARNLRGC